MKVFLSFIFQFISGGDKTDLYDGKQTWISGNTEDRKARDLLSAGGGGGRINFNFLLGSLSLSLSLWYVVMQNEKKTRTQ